MADLGDKPRDGVDLRFEAADLDALLGVGIRSAKGQLQVEADGHGLGLKLAGEGFAQPLGSLSFTNRDRLALFFGPVVPAARLTVVSTDVRSWPFPRHP